MVTIKTYTDLKQSKVLSKILSEESADMFWKNGASDKYIQCFTTFVRDDTNMDYDYDVPCWSLAALLGVLPHIQEFYPTLEKINNRYVCRYKNSGIWTNGINSVDACVNMIIKLHELNLL